MKIRIHLLTAGMIASALTATAQLTGLPSTNTFGESSAYNAASYEAKFGASGLGLYYATHANAPSTTVNSWSYVTQSSDIGASMAWLAGGGTVKVIFLGESAGASNDFGFISKGADVNNAANYTALATDVVNTNGSPGGNIQSGWETLVNYGAGEQLDFWLNNPGTYDGGGTYFSFLQNNLGSAFADGDPYTHSKFAWTSVMTEYVNSSGDTVTGEIETLLIAFEDLRGPALAPGDGLPTIPPGDGDYTDFIVGFQFLPPQLSSVPEPSTYGLIGAGSLIALLAFRRTRASRKARG